MSYSKAVVLTCRKFGDDGHTPVTISSRQVNAQHDDGVDECHWDFANVQSASDSLEKEPKALYSWLHDIGKKLGLHVPFDVLVHLYLARDTGC